MHKQNSISPATLDIAEPLSSKQVAGLRWQTSIVLGFIIILALGLRLYKLDAFDYTDDEVITTFAARQPLINIFHSITANDTHPPLYHTLLHLWIAAFGDNLLVIRLCSVLTSIACVPLIYFLGRMLAGRGVGFTAAALMAIAPFQVFHGQQARMYPLLTLLVLLTMLFFLQAWRRGSWFHWIGLGVCAAAGFYTHAYFAFSLMGLNLWALWEAVRQRQIDWQRWTGLIVAQFLAVLIFAPFLPIMFSLTSSVIGNFWIHENSPVDIVFVLISLSNNATITLNDMPLWYLIATYLPVIAVLLLTLVYSLREAARNPDEHSNWVFLHLSLWTPLVITTVISLTIRPLLLDRSLIGISSPLLLLMAWMAVRFWRNHVVQILAGVFVLTCVATLSYIYPDAPIQNRYREVADYFVHERQPGDAIAYAEWQSFDTSALVYPNLPDVYVLLPSPTADKTGWLRRMEVMNWHTPQNIASIPEFAPRYRRVWLLFTEYTPALEAHRQYNQAWLERHGRLIEKRRFIAGIVYLYELKP